MTYIEGFVTAVPAANKDDYRQHAQEASAMFKEFGVTRMVETWGDDIQDGEQTDFKRTVKAKPDEVVLLSWFEYPDRATRDAASQKMMTDPRMQAGMANMPFDASRMIWGGFATIVDTGTPGGAGYIDGALLAVPEANRQAYEELSAKQCAVIREHGALRVVEAWGDDVPDGKITDYKMAVQAKPDEKVIYSFIEWPSKAVRDTAWAKIFTDPRMQEGQDIYDGSRRVYGGFTPLLDL